MEIRDFLSTILLKFQHERSEVEYELNDKNDRNIPEMIMMVMRTKERKRGSENGAQKKMGKREKME